MDFSNFLKKNIIWWISPLILIIFLGCQDEIESGPLTDDILAPSEVYYGDTVTIIRSSIKTSEEYEIFFSHTQAKVVSVSSGILKFKIPDSISLFDGETDMVRIVLSSEKEIVVFNKEMKFKDPIFSKLEVVPTDFTDLIRVKGNYLHDSNLDVFYKKDPNSVTYLPIESSGDSEIVLKPWGTFNELDPELWLRIRGKTYNLKNLVKFKPTTVEEDQQLKLEIGNLNSTLTITGQNLNPYGTELVITPDFLDWKVVEGSKDSIKIGFNGFKDFIPENFKIQIKLVGGILSNPVDVEVISPVVSQQKFDFFPIFSGVPFVVEEKIQAYTQGLFWELNPSTGDLKKVWGIESPFFDGGFFLKLIGKKAFFLLSGMKLKAFDTETYEFEDLGVVEDILLPFRVYEFHGRLRLENGFIPLKQDSVILKSILREFDPDEKTWTILKEGEDRVFPKLNLPTNVFSYQNELYNISKDFSKDVDEQNYLFRFNPSDQSWENLGALKGDFQEYNAFEVHSVNGRVFFNSSLNWYELEINTLNTRRLDQLSSFVTDPLHFTQRSKGFVIGNKFYILRSLKENEALLLEIDIDSL